MNFKDIIDNDIKQIFLNFEEFGTIHNVAGKQMCIIIDENELTEREKKQFGRCRDGTHKKSLLFYAAARDFGPLPTPDRLLILDNKKYLITEATNEDGIYSICLEESKP